MKADRHAIGSDQQDFCLSIRQTDPSKPVIFIHFYQGEAVPGGTRQLLQGGFLEHTLLGGSEDIPSFEPLFLWR